MLSKMKIQPVDVEPPFRTAKSRFRRLFDRPFSHVLKTSSTEKPVLADQRFKDDLDPNSASLASMVRGYMEDTYDKPPRGLNICNCFHRTCNASSDDEFDASSLGSSSNSIDILKSYVHCATAVERDILRDVAMAVEKMMKPRQRRSDLRKVVAVELSCVGYDSSVCKSKWAKNSSIPAGEYEYIEVIMGGERVVVDIDFRSEFEIARSTEEYATLFQWVPLIFVGSSVRLDHIVGLMCEAAKQSLKKKGMLCPPWRKLDYMRAKWLSPYSRQSPFKFEDQPSHFKPQCHLIFRERPNYKTPNHLPSLDQRRTGLASLLTEKALTVNILNFQI